MREIKMIDGVPKIPKTRQKTGDNQAKRHGDTAVAYALNVWAVEQMDTAPIEYEPLIGENGQGKGLDEYDMGCF
jgi:phage FluMu gp28-like protein